MKKVLGDIVGGFPGENTPLVPRVLPPGPAGWRTTGLRLASRLAPRRRTGGRPPRAVTLLFVMNGFTRPQIIAMFIFRTAALLVIQFNGGGI